MRDPGKGGFKKPKRIRPRTIRTMAARAVLTEKLGDLYAAQGKPSSAAHEYQLALRLDPTPKQKIRLLLAIGDKMRAANHESEAYEAYQTLLRDFPAYPDKVGILKIIVPLAGKLDKKSDMENYEAQLRSLTASK